jgi:hypothetical protein
VGTPGFQLLDVPNSGSVTNGGATVGASSLFFSYATLSSGIYTLTSSATNIVVFGFNGNGAPGDNHDDFVGIATLLPGGNDLPMPIPAALPLFGSVLGGWISFPPASESSSGRSQGRRRLVNLDSVQYQKGPSKRPLFLYYINGNQIRAGFRLGAVGGGVEDTDRHHLPICASRYP